MFIIQIQLPEHFKLLNLRKIRPENNFDSMKINLLNTLLFVQCEYIYKSMTLFDTNIQIECIYYIHLDICFHKYKTINIHVLYIIR